MDHLHPICSVMVTTNCVPPPFRDDLLQIMPWPQFQNITEHDLRAIHEHLSAIPCVEGPAPLATFRERFCMHSRHFTTIVKASARGPLQLEEFAEPLGLRG